MHLHQRHEVGLRALNLELLLRNGHGRLPLQWSRWVRSMLLLLLLRMLRLLLIVGGPLLPGPLLSVLLLWENVRRRSIVSWLRRIRVLALRLMLLLLLLRLLLRSLTSLGRRRSSTAVAGRRVFALSFARSSGCPLRLVIGKVQLFFRDRSVVLTRRIAALVAE